MNTSGFLQIYPEVLDVDLDKMIGINYMDKKAEIKDSLKCGIDDLPL